MTLPSHPSRLRGLTTNVSRWRAAAGWPLIVLLAAAGAAAKVFASLASEMTERELGPLDRAGQHWATAARTPSADAFFGTVTHAGSTAALTIVSLLAAVALRRRHAGRLVIPVVLTPITAVLVATALKLNFARARPESLASLGLGYSFPSGHTTGVTAVLLTLGYILVRERLMGGIHLVWPLFIIVMVGASRVYLGVHWTSDVVGGWTIGFAIAAACCAVYDRSVRRPELSGGSLT